MKIYLTDGKATIKKEIPKFKSFSLEVLQKIENSIPFKIIFNKSAVVHFNFNGSKNFNLDLNETVNELSIETDKSILEIEINFFENDFIENDFIEGL
jgi:hypothetical protein